MCIKSFKPVKSIVNHYPSEAGVNTNQRRSPVQGQFYNIILIAEKSGKRSSYGEKTRYPSMIFHKNPALQRTKRSSFCTEENALKQGPK